MPQKDTVVIRQVDKHINIRWFKLLKCKNLLLFIVLYDFKPNIYEIWTVDHAKQDK